MPTPCLAPRGAVRGVYGGYAVQLDGCEVVGGERYPGALLAVDLVKQEFGVFQDLHECEKWGRAIARHRGSQVVMAEKDMANGTLLRVMVGVDGARITYSLHHPSLHSREVSYQLICITRPKFRLWCSLLRTLPEDEGTVALTDSGPTVAVSFVPRHTIRVHCLVLTASSSALLETTASTALHCVLCLSSYDLWKERLPEKLSAVVLTAVPFGGGGLIVLAPARWIGVVTNVHKASIPGVGGVTFRLCDTLLAVVAADGSTRTPQRTLPRQSCDLTLPTPTIDILNAPAHIFWLGAIDGPQNSVFSFSGPFAVADRSLVPGGCRRLATEDSPTAAVYEVDVTLPYLSLFTGAVPPPSPACALEIKIRRATVNCPSIPSLSRCALHFYTDFSDPAEGGERSIENGSDFHVWEEAELPSLRVVAGYPLEYLRTKVVHVVLRDHSALFPSNLVGTACCSLSPLPDVNPALDLLQCELRGDYCRHDKKWGELVLEVAISPGTPFPDPGFPLPHTLHSDRPSPRRRHDIPSPASHESFHLGGLRLVPDPTPPPYYSPRSPPPRHSPHHHPPHRSPPHHHPPHRSPPHHHPPHHSPPHRSPHHRTYSAHRSRSRNRAESPGQHVVQPHQPPWPVQRISEESPVAPEYRGTLPASKQVFEEYRVLKKPDGKLGIILNRSLQVVDVIRGSPAEEAGLFAGMVVLKVDGIPVHRTSQYTNVLGRCGEAVVLTVAAPPVQPLPHPQWNPSVQVPKPLSTPPPPVTPLLSPRRPSRLLSDLTYKDPPPRSPPSFDAEIVIAASPAPRTISPLRRPPPLRTACF